MLITIHELTTPCLLNITKLKFCNWSIFRDLIEQWIKAKYERQEFVDGADACKQSYANGKAILNIFAI